MSNVKIDFTKNNGNIKVMHAVNNGPHVSRGDQSRGNQDSYRAAVIPFARTHDAAFHAQYGGEHTVDISAVFPNFDADVESEESYDFACTDNYLAQIFEYGAKPFYRLGSKIEHGVKKYGTLVPKDYLKWAKICEHIIAHYTEGWAKGFKYDIEYWEIWNEPDLDPDESTNKRCWGGTEEQFAEFYTVASRCLKDRFPNLKIGGPALAWNEDWLERFFERVKDKNIALDFLSWHWYGTEPREMSAKGTRIYEIAKRYGYENFESILNEWNYVKGWGDEFLYSIETIIGMKGAAFTAACMCQAQKNPTIDMLMYYDARPTAMNGLWDWYTFRPLKGYYPFYMYSHLYRLKNSVEYETDDEDLYVSAACDGDKAACMIVYYAENDSKFGKKVDIDFCSDILDGADIYVVDENNTMAKSLVNTVKDGKLSIWMDRNTVLLIEK